MRKFETQSEIYKKILKMKLLHLLGVVSSIEIKGVEWTPVFYKVGFSNIISEILKLEKQKCLSYFGIQGKPNGVRGFNWDQET